MHSAFRVLLATPAALLILTLLLFFLRPAWAAPLELRCFDKATVEARLLEREGATGLIEGIDADGHIWRWYFSPKARSWLVAVEMLMPNGVVALCPVKDGIGAQPVHPAPVQPAPLNQPAQQPSNLEKSL